jgi:hypothetical protein
MPSETQFATIWPQYGLARHNMDLVAGRLMRNNMDGQEQTGETGMEIFIGSTAPHPLRAYMHPSRSLRNTCRSRLLSPLPFPLVHPFPHPAIPATRGDRLAGSRLCLSYFSLPFFIYFYARPFIFTSTLLLNRGPRCFLGPPLTSPAVRLCLRFPPSFPSAPAVQLGSSRDRRRSRPKVSQHSKPCATCLYLAESL